MSNPTIETITVGNQQYDLHDPTAAAKAVETVVGTGNLDTTSQTLIAAVNELNDKTPEKYIGTPVALESLTPVDTWTRNTTTYTLYEMPNTGLIICSARGGHPGESVSREARIIVGSSGSYTNLITLTLTANYSGPSNFEVIPKGVLLGVASDYSSGLGLIY